MHMNFHFEKFIPLSFKVENRNSFTKYTKAHITYRITEYHRKHRTIILGRNAFLINKKFYAHDFAVVPCSVDTSSIHLIS